VKQVEGRWLLGCDWNPGWSIPNLGHLELVYNCRLLLRLTINNSTCSCLITPMSTDAEPMITHDLMALQTNIWIQPSLVPGNLAAVVGWNAIGELFLVSLQSGPIVARC